MSLDKPFTSKSFDIAKFFQSSKQKSKIFKKVCKINNTYLKSLKPQLLKTNEEEFPQVILKKVHINFRITSRKQSFNQRTIEKKDKLNNLSAEEKIKNPQKLFFLDQDEDQQFINSSSQKKSADSLIQQKNFITLHFKTLELNQQAQKSPKILFQNRLLKQKFEERLKTEECCQIKNDEALNNQNIVRSINVRKRFSQRKGQLVKTQLRKILNQKESKRQKENQLFKIQTFQKKMQTLK